MTATGPGALASVRVVDLSDISGVYGTKVLSDLGADVVRVEPPGGDPMRDVPPFLGGKPGSDRSLVFTYMNIGKRSVALDLDDPAGRASLDRLAACADLVYYSGATQDLDALELPALRQRHPRLVLTTVTPFGLTGPFRSWAGSDLVAWAMGGLASTVGDPDRPPLAPAATAQLAYILGGQFAALSSLAALRTARRSGTGQVVDVSLQECVTAIGGDCGLVTGFLEDLMPRRRAGNRRKTTAPFGHYPTKDGAAAIVTAVPSHWDAFAQWVFERTGNNAVLDPAFKGGPQARAGDMADVINVFAEDFTRSLTRQELFEEGQRRGIPITPVNDAQAVVDDPQLAERQFWTELDIDGEAIRSPGAPYRFSATPWRGGPVPSPGEHSDKILPEWETETGTGGIDRRH